MLSLPRASPATRAAAEPHPGTRRGQRDPRHRGPSTSPPGTATLTSLHGEEEEEEGSGGAAPTASGYGPAARQPGHGFASASAGFRRGTGVRCPPGVYVGHEPSQPARPRRHIDWWKLGPAVTKGTASSPRPSHPDPGPQPRTPAWRDGVCPGEPRRGTGASPFAACSRSRRALPCRAAALRRAEASCVATALCAARPPGRGSGVFAFRAQLAVASPLPPGSWVFMPAADHHHGIRAAGRNCLPFSQPLQPRGCLHRASALCRPPLAPRPLRWLLGGLRNGAGAAFAPPPRSTGATRHGRCGPGTGLGVVLGAPTLLQEMGTFVEAFAGTARAGGVGARSICTPLLAPVVLWGGDPGLGPPAGTTDPTNGGSLTRTGTAAPYPPLGLPVKTVGGCHAGQGAPPAPQLGAPWAGAAGHRAQPQGAAGPCTPWEAAPGSPPPGDTTGEML